jgi:pyruvate dehydrogenase E2 component (dihydrolipoamide acetyltransferase)
MPKAILMPALSPTMTEGNLTSWLKKEGDKIQPGQVLAEIETDKATMEVESIDEGIVGKILIPSGTQNVKVNELIAVILEEGEDASVLDAFIAKQGKVVASTSAAPAPAPVEAPSQQAKQTAKAEDERVFASPLAKRIASNENLDLKEVTGTGPHGRIVKEDVLNRLNNAPALSKQATITLPSIGRSSVEYTTIPNSNMRKTIAKRLQESKQTIPHFYLNVSCEIGSLMDLRQKMNDAADKDKPEYKLSVNDFVILACAKALKKVPEANSSWTESEIKIFNNIDISVAVAIDGGLITPIVKNADQKTISHISNEMKQLANKAKEGKLAPEEYQGGSFCISNLGMYGIKNFNAIINPPQSCILAVGAGEKRPVVKGDSLAVATVMDITLSSDHRVVDGAVGANLLKAIKGYIENPTAMFV